MNINKHTGRKVRSLSAQYLVQAIVWENATTTIALQRTATTDRTVIKFSNVAGREAHSVASLGVVNPGIAGESPVNPGHPVKVLLLSH